MLTASFDTDRSSGAAIHGAVQYDTGQRLKLCGLPGPGEIGCEDERLAGNRETVQVQFAHDGDAQSESLLALWDDGICAWVVGVPDEYLTRAEPVRVYVYIYYGEDDRGGFRGKTMYEGVFTPRSRSAPKDQATPEQLAWLTGMLDEVQLVITAAQTAQQKAATGAQSAADAAGTANAAATRAGDAQARLSGAGGALAGSTYKAVSGQSAGASRSGNVVTLTLPIGADGAAGDTGAKGPKGDTGDTGPSDVAIWLDSGVLQIRTL